MDHFWAFISIFLSWILPIGLCPYIASRQNKDAKWAFLWAFLAGWIGGLLAIAMTKEKDDTAERKAASDDLEEQRREAEQRALGRSSASARYDELVGNRRK